ncbi:MAG: hypothetical protein ACRDGJ_04895 [Candidatus Limnocylindria bacterium]
MGLGELEAELRALLVPYEDVLEMGEIYGMEVLRRPGAKAHDWFAGGQRVDGAVKLTFLPMHGHPELLDGMSPGLRKRNTGASVFKFTTIEPELLTELQGILNRAIDGYLEGRYP